MTLFTPEGDQSEVRRHLPFIGVEKEIEAAEARHHGEHADHSPLILSPR